MLSVKLQPGPLPSARPLCSRALALLAAGWFLIALFVGETQLLSIVPPPVIPATVLTLTSLLMLAYWKWDCLRARLMLIPLENLIALHLTRFVGIYFLHLYRKGELSGSFALAAGWGDIAVASGALLLLVLPRPSRASLLLWNAAGLLDILFVVANAARLITTLPESMAPFMKLPLSFLPTFLVPLIIATHLILFHRLIKAPEDLSPGLGLNQPLPESTFPAAIDLPEKST